MVQLENSFVSPGSNKLHPCPALAIPDELVRLCCVQSRDYLVKVRRYSMNFKKCFLYHKKINAFISITGGRDDVMSKLRPGSDCNQATRDRRGRLQAGCQCVGGVGG